ncbi:MAG: 2-oxoacid:acceptor oxidoreductase subunit alpha [Candidatus Fervidibacter sp.]|uniref:2-oxoacid:acceptor oxidoreductase subunit alpha n=3 Tax=Candidatus Fervidibacter sp. TaxID=3100871 RepID=UPI0040492350
MPVNEFVVRVGGDTLEGGIIRTGEFLAHALARCGLEVFTFRTYPAEIKGGQAMIQVRVSEHPIHSHGDEADILICFDEEAWEIHKSEFNPYGVLIYDSKFEPQNVPGTAVSYGFPFSEIAKARLRNPLSKNMVILGAFSTLFGVPREIFEQLVREYWGRRGEKVVNANIAALAEGIEEAKRIEKRDDYRIEVRPMRDRIILSGNEAICYGAIAAKCKVFAGYPITPASDILEWMMEHLPHFGGTPLQVEDEIAAIGAVIGASFAGAKAMTATSGPGFSLMTEFLGHAAMAEIPCVIADIQRAGPSTGMPTKSEQSDLYQAVFGGHGDVPRIVLAPSTVQGCFYVTIHAFNLAELCQLPVIILSDQSLAHRTETIPPIDLSKIIVIDREVYEPTVTFGDGYRRYRLSETGVSPMSIPGLSGSYTAEGLEHDEFGHPNWNPENHMVMTEKRFRKLQLALRYDEYYPGFQGYRWYGPSQADVGVIAWGSTVGAVREASELAEREGISVAVLHVSMIYPLHREIVRRFITSMKHVFLPELNYTGQFAHLIRGETGLEVVSFSKVTGIPFKVREILEAIKELAKEPAHAR